ncbi:CDP-glycerol glycerophosphotransferase family protein [Photobacterium lutimaris]|uniref:CDP-glycerol--glycerophosphate glycerophosphotransferase n=1 Tax=Photobacterium lutimaris TaxID=388278 RepID=A0A2T3IND7_9GAMM|nr:CDP-glycerol glycerophosphotransferase family protein [Photobacterium lutimaris]PSU29858.1 hypothetical protein C9I99_24295 [Photobacterium lutimaris]TDR75282.1 CDP-glycerol glycerophosphotransferase (TagB/SpsB family) [Photobacterium lutimaris]
MSRGFNNKYLRFISQVTLAVASFPMKWVSLLIPVDKKIWVFGNAYGYKDNPKYVYEFLLKNEDHTVRPIWISKNNAVSDHGILGESYYYLSLKGLYYQYRASAALLATGMNDVASFTLGNKQIIQLWHGIPIKKLLLDSVETSPIPPRFKYLNKVFFQLLKKKLNRYGMVCAVNEHNQHCLARAFGLRLDKVKVTGMPRHDVILESAKNAVKKTEKSKRILYAPTWHASLEDARNWLSQVLNPELLHYCQLNGISVDVSIHPLNQALATDTSLFHDVTLLQCDDINEQLKNYDLLITDYSSIAFDFSILGRPVIFSCAEIEKYAKERGIYEDFISLLHEQNATGKSLIEKIDDSLMDGRKVASIYDYPQLGKARSKVIEEVKKLI